MEFVLKALEGIFSIVLLLVSVCIKQTRLV